MVAPHKQKKEYNMTKATSNLPTHFAYSVQEFESNGEKKSTWTKIGSAWPHQDGNGFNLNLDCLPVNGKITIRVAKESSGE